jgi:4-amino-4-deoxy-L-arabinose transferase-like glycosyltransferase
MTRSRAALLFAALVAAALLVFWYSRITGAPVLSDSMATAQLGVNLAHHGVLSIDEQPPLQPSMYREPAPGAVAALLVKVADGIWGPAPQSEYLHGERARLLKLQNLLWFALLCATTAIAVRWWTGSLVLAVFTAVAAQAVYFYPAMLSYGIDSLFSDIPAAALLTLVSLLLARAFTRGHWPLAGLAGLLLGVLTLTKAALLYVTVGLAGCGVLFMLWRRREQDPRSGLAAVAAMLVGCLLVAGPWLARNHALFGVWAVADRGGLSLYTRVLKDQMSDEEFRGAFYAWTPGPLQGLVGRATGFGPQDLQPGGRLHRFPHAADDTPLHEKERAAEREGRPADALAWYYQGRAERVKRTREAEARGEPHPPLAADQSLQRDALAWMKAHPGPHLKLSLPYLWRGALVIFPALCLGLAYALWRRSDELLWFVLPSLGLILFYALFANFEERYGIPALPVALASGIIVVWRLLRPARQRS